LQLYRLDRLVGVIAAALKGSNIIEGAGCISLRGAVADVRAATEQNVALGVIDRGDTVDVVAAVSVISTRAYIIELQRVALKETALYTCGEGLELRRPIVGIDEVRSLTELRLQSLR
jgi:hypothetical protein